MMPDLISIVVPCFNEEQLIGHCIASIYREMSGYDHEVIVVDNCSTDNTATIAKELGCTVLTEDRKGVTRARQKGFEAAKGDIVVFIDADNIIPPGWLWFLLENFNDPKVVAASGPVIFYDLPLHKRIAASAFYTIAKFVHIFMPMMQGGNFIVRKDSLIKAGGFNTNIDFFGEDTDTAIRMSKQGKVVFDLDMFVYSSGRRMAKEGLVLTGFRYIVNYIWMWVFRRPFTTRYSDVRPIK